MPSASGLQNAFASRHPVRGDFELMSSERPRYAPTQRELESRQRLHHQRISVLRTEATVVHDGGVAGPPFLRLVLERCGQPCSPMEHALGRIEVDDLQPIADGPLHELLRWDVDRRHDDLPVAGDAGVLSEDGDLPGGRACGAVAPFRWA